MNFDNGSTTRLSQRQSIPVIGQARGRAENTSPPTALSIALSWSCSVQSVRKYGKVLYYTISYLRRIQISPRFEFYIVTGCKDNLIHFKKSDITSKVASSEQTMMRFYVSVETSDGSSFILGHGLQRADSSKIHQLYTLNNNEAGSVSEMLSKRYSTSFAMNSKCYKFTVTGEHSHRFASQPM